ncbi:MAG: hypothetical protein KA369_15820 [Spirochaetes bacterium]|nr:hypothetical protein [Spirochaetota bacterium]
MGRLFFLMIALAVLGTTLSSCDSFDTNSSLKKIMLGLSMEVIPPGPPAGAFTLSQFGVTWYFDRTLAAGADYGQYANGDYWVVGPVNIIYIDPISYRSRTGRVLNGSMVNPSPKNGSTQGYDSATYGQYGPYFDAALNAAMPGGAYISAGNPLVMRPGSSLVSAISGPEPGARSQLDGAAILTVVNAPPPEGSFRPPYCGSDKTPRFNESDLDSTILANPTILKSLDRSVIQGVPAMADIERYFERPWLDHVPGWVGGYIHPTGNMPNYGREIASEVGEGALMLHLDFTLEQKRTLLIRYVQLGIDLYGIVLDGGEENWPNNGGHASGRKWPIMFAGLMLGGSEFGGPGIADLMADIGARSGDFTGTDHVHFGEDDQTFYITAGDIARDHHPDERACELEYSSTDEGLPEWGIVHQAEPNADNKNWEAVYRQCCTAHAWGGFLLSALIMNQKANWNHDVIFDYMDRYMAVELAVNGTGAWTRCWSHFVENAWDYYRKNYGTIWPAGTAWDGTDLTLGLFCD